MKVDVTDLHAKMSETANIRNISVIAHVDHGKTTMTDSLVQAAGIIPSKNAGTARYTDTRADEQERCITIKSTVLSCLHHHTKIVCKDNDISSEYKEIIINLIDSPGHIDFTSEVTAALRVTDGAIIVVDTTKGTQSQTETVIKQAIQERIKFVLMMNKADAMFNQYCTTRGNYGANDDVYHCFSTIIQDINTIVDKHLKEDPRVPEYTKETVKIDMCSNNVAFGSAKMGWAMTLNSAYDFVKRAEKPTAQGPKEKQVEYYTKKARTMKLLWGENYINIESKKKWRTAAPKGEEKKVWIRGFIYFVMEALLEVQSLCQPENRDALKQLINDKNFTYPVDQKELERNVMRHLFPMPNVLMSMISDKLPSPIEAQKYRSFNLSTDPDASGPSSMALKKCDPKGPLMVFCSKKTPRGDLSKPLIVTVGRIFSGTLHSNSKVLCMNDKYNIETPITKDLKGNVQNVMIMIGKAMENVSKMPCGNIIGMTGIDQEMPGPGTLVDWPENLVNTFYPVTNMKFTSVAIVGQRVTPRQTKDADKLIRAARAVQKLDLTAKIETEDTGVLVFGVGALHTEILVQDLRDIFGGEVFISEQIVNCAETVTSDEPRESMTKSANHHNRITCKAYMLADDFTDYIDEVTNPEGFTVADLKEKGFQLGWGMDNVKLNNDNLKRVLDIGSNILYNGVAGFDMGEIGQYIVDGLKRAEYEGPLCGERIRGVEYALTAAVTHADAIHRGGNQITPQCVRLFAGSILRASPVLTEPMYTVIVEGPNEFFPAVNKLMNKQNAKMMSVEQDDMTTVGKYSLSMFKSIKIQPEIMTASSGRFTTRLEFSGYEPIPGSMDDTESELVKRIAMKRAENKLPEIAKGTDHYLDRL